MFWTDGSIYQGEWRNGIQHGFGKMTFPDGTVKEGQFENNIFVGDVQTALAVGDTVLSDNESPKNGAATLTKK